MYGPALLLLIGLVLLWAGGVIGIAWMLTHPPRRTYAWAVARGRPGDPSELDRPRRFELWVVQSRGLELPVWEIEGDDPSGPTVVLTHGWGDSRVGALARVPALAPVASRIIAWDVPGHGEAPGTCALGLLEAADLLALLERSGRGNGVVLYGWSLGAGVSLVAAQSSRPLAVVAESPYRLAETPARNVLAVRGLPHRAMLGPALAIVRVLARGTPLPYGRGSVGSEPFDRAWHSARVTCPVLVVHGVEDEVCPIEDGLAIAAAAPRGQITEIAAGHHNDLWTDPALAARCAGAVQAFIREATSRGKPGS